MKQSLISVLIFLLPVSMTIAGDNPGSTGKSWSERLDYWKSSGRLQSCRELFQESVTARYPQQLSNSDRNRLRKWWWVPGNVFDDKWVPCADWAKKAHSRNEKETNKLAEDCQLVLKISRETQEEFFCESPTEPLD